MASKTQLLNGSKIFSLIRSQWVILYGQSSNDAPVTSGVPQGTVIGPLLFLVYINDLPDRVSSTVRMFADDCLLYRTIQDVQDTTILQADLNHLQEWEAESLMDFNPSKCEVITLTKKTKPVTCTYTIHNTPLATVNCAQYLGLNITSKLSGITTLTPSPSVWHSRNFPSCPTQIREQCYMTLVRPQLEYASSVWDNSVQRNIQKVESVQSAETWKSKRTI